MAIIDCVSTVVWLPGMNKDIVHTFIVSKDLIAPAIVGVDFFQQHKLTVDFSKKVYRFTHYLRVPCQIICSIFGKLLSSTNHKLTMLQQH